MDSGNYWCRLIGLIEEQKNLEVMKEKKKIGDDCECEFY